MKNLILTLNRANLTESDLETVLTEFDIWVDSKVQRCEQKIMSQFFVPIQKETEGIRGEIRMLAETMKTGYEKLDQKLDFTRKSLELQISTTRENLELQINSNRENLENQIKANEKNMEKQFSFQQKLLWAVLSVVLGLFAKAIHLI
jgi:lipopolysaccharide export LptBFGC system permease protein LptF